MIGTKVLTVILVIYWFTTENVCFAGVTVLPPPSSGTVNPYSLFEISMLKLYPISSTVPGLDSDSVQCIQTKFAIIGPAIVTALNQAFSAFSSAVKGIIDGALVSNVYKIEQALLGYFTSAGAIYAQLLVTLKPVPLGFQQYPATVSPVLKPDIVYFYGESRAEFYLQVSDIEYDGLASLADFFDDCNKLPEFIYGGASIVITAANQLFAIVKAGFNTNSYFFVATGFFKNIGKNYCLLVTDVAVNEPIVTISELLINLGLLLTTFSNLLIAFLTTFGGNSFDYD